MYFQICLISYCFKIYLFWYLAIPGPVYFVWCWNGVCFSEHRIEFEKCPNLRDILVSQMKMKIMFISLLKLSDSVWNLVFQLLDLKEWHLHRIQNRQTCFTLFFFFYSYGGVRPGLWGNTASNGPISHLSTDKWMWDTGHMVNDRRKLKYLEKNLSQWHFVHYMSHTDGPRIESRSLQWETSN